VQLKEAVWKEWKQTALTQTEFLWGPTGGAERRNGDGESENNVGTVGRDSDYLILHSS